MMKKLSVRITALVMCAVMCAALAACGSPQQSKLDWQQQAKDNLDSLVQDAKQNVDSAIQDYLDKNKAEYDAVIAASEEQSQGTATLSIFARDGSLVYSYRYTIEVDAAEGKSILDASLDTESSFFESSYDELASEIPGLLSLVVEYLDMNGNLITSRSFS